MFIAFVLSFVLMLMLIPAASFAAWTPLIASTDFDGIRSDLLTASGGLLTLMLICLGLGLLWRSFR